MAKLRGNVHHFSHLFTMCRRRRGRGWWLIRNYGKLLQLLHFLLRSVYQLNFWQNYEEMFTISHTYSPCVGGGEEEVDGTHLLAPGKFPCKIFPFSFVSHRQFWQFLLYSSFHFEVSVFFTHTSLLQRKQLEPQCCETKLRPIKNNNNNSKIRVWSKGENIQVRKEREAL